MMIQTGDGLLKERAHCQATVGYFLGSVGLKLAKKENYKIMFEFPFDKFLEGEVPIFANPEDKNDACYACLKIF
uniref:Uncharacterized protein n=1 Tax=Panagrolaimus sp. JU765 TaxID=591449 RepID=A0AC34R4N3_9BILA